MVVDVIYELTDKAAAIWSVFTIDPLLELLNTDFDDDGNIILPTDWNSYWAISTKCFGVDMFNTRFSVANYMKLINAEIPGFRVLIAGFPSDDVETMLVNRKLEFTRTEYNLDGSVVEVPDIMLDENGNPGFGIRIAPDDEACDRYRELYPETQTMFIDGNEEITFNVSNFSNHGL